MRNMKRNFAVLAATVMAVCSIALTGCQQKLEPADQVVGALYELSVKENATPMKDLLGFASEEVMISATPTGRIPLSKSFTNEGEIQYLSKSRVESSP